MHCRRTYRRSRRPPFSHNLTNNATKRAGVFLPRKFALETKRGKKRNGREFFSLFSLFSSLFSLPRLASTHIQLLTQRPVPSTRSALKTASLLITPQPLSSALDTHSALSQHTPFSHTPLSLSLSQHFSHTQHFQHIPQTHTHLITRHTPSSPLSLNSQLSPFHPRL